MKLAIGSSATVPPARSMRSSDRHDAAGAPYSELLQSTAVWSTSSSTSSQGHQDTLETQSKPPFESDDELSPPSSAHSSVVDLSSPTGSVDSDFEFVDNSQEVPQADDTDENTSTSRANNLLPGIPSSRTRRSSKGTAPAASAYRGHQTGLPGASGMDAGSSNDYGDSDWHQAGDDATQQDLAGPGVQGFLECIVDKPQKEGEGTQNAYISYLVTTNVRSEVFAL